MTKYGPDFVPDARQTAIADRKMALARDTVERLVQRMQSGDLSAQFPPMISVGLAAVDEILEHTNSNDEAFGMAVSLIAAAIVRIVAVEDPHAPGGALSNFTG
jgi:hypothetical protein